MSKSKPITRLGVLKDKLEWSSPEPGIYLVEGHVVSQVKSRHWHALGHTFYSLTDVFETIAEREGKA